MPKPRRRRILPVGALLWLLIAAVLIPAILSIAVGVVALALSRQAFDIVIGVLVLCFALAAVAGASVALGLTRRSERLAQMQSDFVANVSHELRTPLAGIRLLAETLGRGRADTPERNEEVADLLLAQVDRLHGAIDRILRWRLIESGAAAYVREALPVSTIVAEAVDPLTATLNGAEVRVAVDPGLPPILGDRHAVVDAVRNLVDNAIKFGGDRGPVEVIARGEGDNVVVEVRDQGPGIPRAERKRIFNRFYRVPVHARAKQGTGLGLAIVRSIVKDHDGEIHVESEPGIGSAFILRLPTTSEAAVPSPQVDSASAPPPSDSHGG